VSAPQGDNIRTDAGHDLPGVLEALLFASAEPLTIEELRVALPECTTAEIEAGLAALAQALGAPDRGLLLEKIAGGHRLATRPEFAPSLQLLFRFRNQKRLSAASLDVLAIIAYAQPITGPEIHEIRGADPAYALHSLLERRLIRIIGRKRVVGRPLLYGTTRDFLVHFGLDSLEDLPPVAGFDTLVAPAQGRLFSVAETEIEPLPETAGASATPSGTVPGLSPAATAPAERVAGPRLAED
jgi:segregation and condensation protein B